MTKLHIQLFGDFRLILHDEPVHGIYEPQCQALLAYLMLHSERSIPKHELAHHIWPKTPVPIALESLDSTVTSLRNALPSLGTFLTLTPDTLQWQLAEPFSLDITDFTLTLAQAQAAAQVSDDQAVAQALTHALTLYRGEFLPLCNQDWVVEERRRSHALYINVLVQLAPILEQKGDYARAVACARILHRHNRHYEALHQRLTHLYVLNGSRVDQLRTLEERLEALRHGQGALVLIQGVAGIGKSSLALACEERARHLDIGFAMGRCYGQGVTAPFMPWQEMLAALAHVGVLKADGLPAPFGYSVLVHSAQQLIQSVTQQLVAAAVARPLVLLLDDLHWADQDSLDLLDFVTRQVAHIPLLILVTYRSEEIQRGHPLFSLLPTLQRNRPVETIYLTALTLEDTGRLLEAYHGPCTPQLVRYLHTRAEGHPLFLVQLLNHLVEQKLLVQEESGVWQMPTHTTSIPTYIQQVIIGRIASLGSEAEQFLTVAAVIGEKWDLFIVETVLAWPEEKILAVLDSGLATGVISASDEAVERYRFTHGLIREVLYSQTLVRRRKQFHARIAALLADYDPANAATLAYHYFAAEQWRQAWHYSLAAGNVAQERYAIHSAISFYRQALTALQKLPDMATDETLLQLYERIGNICKAINHKEDAEVAYTHMVEYARRAANHPAEARALFQLAMIQARRYQYDAARATGNLALGVTEEVEVVDPLLQTLKYQRLSQTAVMRGDLVEAARYVVQFEHYARTSEEPDLEAHALRFRGNLAIWAGQYTQAEQFVAKGMGAASATENTIALAGFAFVRGFALIELGSYAAARQVLQEGLVYAEQLGEHFHYLTKLLNMMSYLYHEVGDFVAALHWSQRALAAQRAEGGDHYLEAACYTLLDLATNHFRLGQLAATQSYLREFEDLLGQHDSGRFRFLNRYQLLQAELALAHSDFAQVFVHTQEATALAREKNMPKNLAKSALYEGQALLALNRPQEAATLFQQALTLADQIEHAALRWQSRLHLAQAYTRLARPTAELYDHALTIVEGLAANLQDERLRSCFLTSPLIIELKTNAQSAIQQPQLSTPLQAAKQAYDGLTRREREVAALIAQGKSNRAIAETLVIGERTVEGYVSSILSKLDFTSRTQIAAWAIKKDLHASSE